MEEKQKDQKEGKKGKQDIKGIIFLFAKKMIFIAVIILLMIILCGGGYYFIKQDDFEEVSDTSEAHSTTVNSNGQVVYTTQNENNETVELTPEQMAEEYRGVLQPYISEDDQEYSEIMQELMGAETVTSMPYIDGRADGELNGGVKFYRYTNAEDEVNEANITEEHRLTYKTLEEFNAKMAAYEIDAASNRDIFNYFTIDSDGAVLVAYGSEEYREIHTGPDAAGATDKDLDIGIINGNSTFESSYSGHYMAGFYANKFTISTKKIDYRSLVDQYKMPSTLLYTFLIQTENVDFVRALAEIAYGSQIAIGIYDNKSYSETNEMYTYKKLMDMSIKTDIEYDDTLVHIPESGETGPEFYFTRVDDLYYGDYQYIVELCETETINESGTVEHQVTYMNPTDHSGPTAQGWVAHQNTKMYIGGTDNNNKITSLGEGETYKTKYKKTKETMSTPTVGVLLADTWIAKWVASYTKETINTPESTTSETAIEDKIIKDYGTGVVTGAFSSVGGTYGEISAHATTQINNTKQQIIQQVNQRGILEVSQAQVALTYQQKLEIMRSHLVNYNTHEVLCTNCYQTGWTSEELLNEIENGNHYCAEYEDILRDRESDLIEAARETARQQTNARIAEFERQIEQENKISYSVTCSGSKWYSKASYTSSSSGNSSQYNKSQEIQRADDGVKFSEVFNRDEFNSVRGIFNETEAWFWEYIDENEDTAKIKNILKYLFNIATNSERYGTFTTEQIEQLFSAFEPKEMITTTKIYGNTIEEKVWIALINEGYSKIAVAGVLANLFEESNLRSNNLEQDYEKILGYTDETYTEAVNNGTYSLEQFISDHNQEECGAGYGIAQWTYYTRKEGLYNFAKWRGVGIDDEDMQIEYLIGEMTPSGGADGYADYVLGKCNGYTVDDWKNAESPEDAAVAFCWIFEKPEKPRLDDRKESARRFFEKYKNFEMGGNYEKDTSGDERIAGRFTSSRTGRTFTIFKQGKIPGWDWLCNRAAQISICSGYWNGTVDELIGEVTSKAPADKNLYEKCGLTCSLQEDGMNDKKHTFEKNKIKEQLENGGYVLLYVRGSYHGDDGVSKNGTDWAKKAHWVAILDYRELNVGENGEIFTSDSSSRGHNGWYPLDEFEGITDKVYFVNEK